MTKDQLIKEFELLTTGNEGIESFVCPKSNERIFARLQSIESEPLNKVQLNQLIVLCLERGVSDDYYKYYWFTKPENHPYDVGKLPFFDKGYLNQDSHEIKTLNHLKWGLYRIFVDGLLFFGNVRYSYKQLASMNNLALVSFFQSKCFDTKAIKDRGPALPLKSIAKDDRYLISEMACKSYGENPDSGELKSALLAAWKTRGNKSGPVKIRDLLDGSFAQGNHTATSQQLLFSADEILNDVVANETELQEKYAKIAQAFSNARDAALGNTELYLSVVNDLGVYVATSMRTRDDFRKMASDCEAIFAATKLKDLHLRYFDPTMSAADGHQDKGLIECLMVKCAKVLVYCAGVKDSYGKDAEAAMALSLGKTVIFFCDEEQRKHFYRDVHPLSRLIEFSSGVAMGAIVTDKRDEVSELLLRLFENKLEYTLEQPKLGYLQLKETLTGSVVRLQTNNALLSKAFWNYYNTQDQR